MSAADSSHQNGNGNGCRGVTPNILEASSAVPASLMTITWGKDERFWKPAQLSEDEMLPEKLAVGCGSELIQVNWLEAKGRVELNSAVSGAYEVVFHVKFKRDAFGWSKSPVTMMVRAGGRPEIRKIDMESFRRKGVEVWQEIPGGEFTVAAAGKKEVEFGMWDVENGWWKGGLILAGVSIRPKK